MIKRRLAAAGITAALALNPAAPTQAVNPQELANMASSYIFASTDPEHSPTNVINGTFGPSSIWMGRAFFLFGIPLIVLTTVGVVITAIVMAIDKHALQLSSE